MLSMEQNLTTNFIFIYKRLRETRPGLRETRPGGEAGLTQRALQSPILVFLPLFLLVDFLEMLL